MPPKPKPFRVPGLEYRVSAELFSSSAAPVILSFAYQGEKCFDTSWTPDAAEAMGNSLMKMAELCRREHSKGLHGDPEELLKRVKEAGEGK